MKCHLSFFDGLILLEWGKSSQDFAWVKDDDSAYISCRRGHITCRLEHLRSFTAELPMHLDTLRAQQGPNPRCFTTCKIGYGEISFWAEPSKVCNRLVRVLNRIWSLLQLAKVVLDQMKRCPLTMNVSLDFFVPKQEINGVSVKHFLESRKEAALKIDPRTARVLRTKVYGVDPYGVYSKIPELYKDDIYRDYYACAPGSEIWVYSEDLPEETRRALEMKHHLAV